MRRSAMHQKELPDPIQVPMLPELIGRIEVGARRYMMGRNIQILIGWSSSGWHLSISHVRRYPTWDEIAHARDKLLPKELTFVMVLPSPEEYVNLHPYCFHLWEARDMRSTGGPIVYSSTEATHREVVR